MYNEIMPRYARKTKKKGSYRRRRRRIPRTLANIVPDSHIVKLRYVDIVSLDAATGLNSTHVFRANSIYDPDYTGIGHSPMGVNEWSNMYLHYNVLGSKCTAQFTATGVNSSADACMVGILLKAEPGNITLPTDIMEQSKSGYSFLTGQNGIGVKKIRKGFSCKKFFGLKDVADNRAIVGAGFGSNPSEAAYFQVYQCAMGAADNPRPVDVVVTIEYIVQFTERKTLAQS